MSYEPLGDDLKGISEQSGSREFKTLRKGDTPFPDVVCPIPRMMEKIHLLGNSPPWHSFYFHYVYKPLCFSITWYES